MNEKIDILVGIDLSRNRFNTFYEKSIYLAKNEILKKADKIKLLLETEHFSIRFIPSKNDNAVNGLMCDWAYGFSPDATNFLEFRTLERIKAIKPVVENVDELFDFIKKTEEGG